MASIVVCAEPGSWQQASRFAEKALGNAGAGKVLKISRGGERLVQPLLRCS